MLKFQMLQVQHYALLGKLEAKVDNEILQGLVQEFVQRVRSESARVASSRERDQLRAILRFWASYLYDQTGVYPDTTLHPSQTPEGQPSAPLPDGKENFPAKKKSFGLAVLAILLIAVLVIILQSNYGASSADTFGTISAAIKTAETGSPTETVEIVGERPPDTDTPPTLPAVNPLPLQTPTGTPTPTPAQGAERTPGPTATALPQTGGGGGEAGFAAASVFLPQTPGDCQGPALVLVPTRHEAGEAGGFGEAALTITRAGNQEPLYQNTVLLNGEPLEIGLPPASQKETLLLQMEYAAYPFSSLIIDYPPGCAAHPLTVEYEPPEIIEPDVIGQGAESALELDWRLLTWGPAPFSSQWAAVLLLEPQGGDGSYLFWAAGDVQNNGAEPLPDNRVTVLGPECSPAQVSVGLTSAGESISKNILLAPFCPVQDE